MWLQPRDVPAADAALGRSGFHHFKARGVGRHRFYLAFEDGHWLKLDAKLVDDEDGARRRPDGPSRWTDRTKRRLARKWFASLRRTGPVIAVLGPDGAGKGSVIVGLQRVIPVAVTPVYLGFRGKRTSAPSDQRTTTSTAGRPSAAREAAFVLRTALRQWRRLLPAYVAAWRGDIVLCDRHPVEVLAVRPNRRPLVGRLERFIATRLIPRPDAVIILDAPGETLYRRKGEHSVNVLEAWRRSYAEVFLPRGAVIVQTMRAPKVAVAQSSEIVWGALQRRRGW